MLHRGRKADRRVQTAPSASLCFADFTVRAGSGGDSTQSSPSQRNNSRKRLFGPEVCASRKFVIARFGGQGITHWTFCESRVPRNPGAVSLDSSGCARRIRAQSRRSLTPSTSRFRSAARSCGRRGRPLPSAPPVRPARRRGRRPGQQSYQHLPPSACDGQSP